MKVGVSQLAVDGAQDLEVLRSNLDGRLKEGHAGPIVSRLAQALALQGEVQTRRLHPAEQHDPGEEREFTLSTTSLTCTWEWLQVRLKFF